MQENESAMQYQNLGKTDVLVSRIGVGCYNMTSAYGKSDPQDARNTIFRAIELGVNFFDTADSYAFGKNEELVGQALKSRRQNIILATKFGQVVSPDGKREINGHPDYVRKACEASLKRLNTDYIDLYYQHRVDKKVPIDDTVGEMGRLMDEGKIRAIGLSEASPVNVEKAQSRRNIAALQIEYSLWTRFIEEAHLPLCKNLGITIVGYAPLGRGFFTGKIRTVKDLAAGEDRRKHHPRFEAENIEKNVAILDPVEKLAARKKCTMAQLALAWTLSGTGLISLPGVSKVDHLEENVKSLDFELSAEERELLSTSINIHQIAGERYPEAMIDKVNA